jgi:hypothetical protein
MIFVAMLDGTGRVIPDFLDIPRTAAGNSNKNSHNKGPQG